jgi:lipoate-protein ligase A
MKIFLGFNPLLDFSFEREILSNGTDETLLLISHWKEKNLILGYAQDLKGINKEEAKKCGVEIFRRSSGGTAVLSTDSINISLFIPSLHPLAKPIEELYKMFLETLKDALLKMGKDVEISRIREKTNSPICFLSQSGETLLSDGKKFFGGAQARNKKVLLVQGTMLLNFDAGLHSRIFGFDESVLKEKITSISLDFEIFVNQIIKSFQKTLKSRTFDTEQFISPSKQFIMETQTTKWMP